LLHHLATATASHHVGLFVALPFITPPSQWPRLFDASHIVVTPSLNVLAGCTLPFIVPPSCLTRLVVMSPLITATVAHHDHVTILPSIALSLQSPIAIAPP
jgi:hypothetical protein